MKHTPHKRFMKEAIKLAEKSARKKEYAIGAVVVCNGKIVGRGENRGFRTKDASNHAEIVALRAASRKLKSRYLRECVLYTTHEPCCMCVGMAIWSQLGGVVYGVPVRELRAFGLRFGNDQKLIPCRQILKGYGSKAFVKGPFMKKECLKLFEVYPLERFGELFVKESSAGKGVFAGRAFKKGETVLKCTGDFFTRKQLLKKGKWALDHSLQIGDDLYMGPGEDIEDYVNHSCDPSTGHMIRGRSAKLVALRNIKEGEEITFDYFTTMWKTGERMRCLCGAKKCRGVVKDFDKFPEDLQKSYIKKGVVPRYIVERVKK